RVQSRNYHIMGLPENGSFAQYLLVSEDRLIQCPEHLSNEEAAALPLAGLTAYRALFTRAQCRPKERVLISGFGGGVASTAFLFARAINCELYVSSSSAEKRELAMKMGAKAAFDYREKGFGKKIYKDHGGVDVVIDGAAGEGFGELVEACRPAGRISVYGGTAGKAMMSPQKLFWKQLNILGSTMGSDKDFQEMVGFVEQHKISPLVSSVHSLSDGKVAFEAMDRQEQTGKIVLIP
ncbi:MAG TPA: zinc-binding dehydrogenase, partial [Saprospiraceae bacterium]|nr:zinc-binding dehydrogenase [Saprospiraceae bacterium]